MSWKLGQEPELEKVKAGEVEAAGLGPGPGWLRGIADF